MATLSLKNVCKKYPNNDKLAVTDFNLEIRDKEFIILVGPSGCGKSTTLRMVAGLEEISSGECYIDDRLVNNVAPKDRDIAMVFQDYALYPHMSVYENMAFGLRLHGIPKKDIERRVKEAARILDIQKFLERKPAALSGGQRQRVALGRAIVREPKVFLLDEPLSNLDAKLRNQMRTEISKLHNKLGTTFIYVTHDQVEAMTMADRIVVMKDGYIQQVADPDTLYNHPGNLFVASFIGTPMMNFLEGRVIDLGSCVGFEYGEQKKFLFKLPPEKYKKEFFRNYFGNTIIMGVRSEDMHDEADYLAEHPDSIFEAFVEVTEPMGSETYLYLSCEGQSMTARVKPTTTTKDGSTIRIAIDTNRVHCFDREDEQIIID
ncbi:MAG TPA: sn-glycerol-3-phosphate ABC transporter ATP-binding protein UgpC [Oscillospiraceae bacterium]|nr:sn-glycerol-3-phosphate ABC transporter ATP-binding protein UgpC [Oscillospiraceae bacterium]HPS34955.1 sn-glycerol-3-phosphate ABC transporter ATP-binding protein UgpC [Oscillospiraceae bacterium]